MNRNIRSIPSVFLKVTIAGLMLTLGLLFPNLVSGQFSTNCFNSNFSNGNWKNWSAAYGTWNCTNNCCMAWKQKMGFPAFHPTGHVLIPAPGYHDPQTGGGLLTVFPGESFSARVGDSLTGAYWESLIFHITVSPDDYLFVYRYAVVLEDPLHDSCNQPGFFITVTDNTGAIIDSTCGYYAVFAQEGLPGWNSFGSTRWRDWTTVGMNLSQYVGQDLQVTFTTRDCSQSGHFGYAYVNAYCNALELQVALCEGEDSAVLTAPAGFEYVWSNGSIANTITVPATLNAQYWVKITSYNGCTDTIFSTITYTVVDADFSFTSNCATLPAQFHDETTLNQNSVVGWEWNFGDGSPVVTGNPNPTHAFPAPGSYIVKLKSFSTEGCTDSIEHTIMVDSLPHLTNTPLDTIICHNTLLNLNLTSDVTGTTFTWTTSATSPNLGGYSNQVTPTTTLSQTLTNVGIDIDSVIYHILPQKNACIGNNTDYTVSVMPIPALTNNPVNKTICDNSLTNLNLQSNNSNTNFTWTCTSTSPLITGYSDNTTTPGKLINQLLHNSGLDVDTVIYHITPILFGCLGTTVDFYMIVLPTPVVTITPLNKTICDNTATNINLANPYGFTYTWNCTPSSVNITGYGSNAVPSTLINQTLDVTGTNNESVVYHLTPHIQACTGPMADYTVNVNATPLLTNSPLSQNICSNVATNLPLTTNIAGTLFTWTCTPSSANITGWANNAVPGTLLNQTLVNTGNVQESVTYHITPHYNGCDGPVTDYLFKVYPNPLLTNSPAASAICSNANTSVTLTSNVVVALFTWTCTPSSAAVTGWANNAVPTKNLNQVLVNSGTTIETVTYHVTPTANGCTGPVADYVVTVYPTPNLSNSPASKSICDNTATNITLTSNVAGTLFTWTFGTSSANVTGAANSGAPGTTINQTLDNTGFNTETVTYHITPIANGCPGTVANYVVTVFPTPTLTNVPASKSQCDNVATGVTLTSAVAGTLFTWTAAPSSANVTGWADNAVPTVTLNQTLDNTGFNTETVTYHVTPSANGCPGTLKDFVVTVFPTPNLSNLPLSKSQCDNVPTNIPLTSNVAGTLFTWTCGPSSANITGFSNNAVPVATLNQTLDNTGSNIETVTYHITPVANGCTGVSTDYVVTVYPTPTLTNSPATQQQCNNTATNLTLTSNVAGAQFTWTCTPSSANITGWANNAVPATLINQTLVNSGLGIETVTYHITPQANGCSGPSKDFVVSVILTTDLSNSPPAKSQCNNQNTNIILTSSVVGTTFTWTCTPSSANITGWANNAVPTTLLNQLLVNSGTAIETVTYHIQPSASGCTGTMKDYIVTVYPTPLLTTLPLAKSLCNNSNTNIPLSSNVAGTLFTWTCTPSSASITGWVNNAVPAGAVNNLLVNSGSNIENVVYNITPVANGCNGPSLNYTVTVFPTATLTNAPAAKTQCDNLPTGITLTSAVAGTQFTWTTTPSSANVTGWADNAVPTTALNQTLDNTGFNIETVTYHITPSANGCPGTLKDYVVTVNPTPDLSNATLTKSQCDNVPTNIPLTSNVAGTLFTWTCTPSSGSITGWANNAVASNLLNQTLDNTGFNTESIVYHITPIANGCNGAVADYTVTVYPTPNLSNTPLSKSQCDNLPTGITLTSNVATTLFTWTATPSSANITGWSDNAVPTTALNHTLDNTGFNIETVTYHITPLANGCSGSVTDYTVTIFPTPNLSNAPASKTQCDNLPTNINLTSNVAGTLFTWTCTPSSASITGWANSAAPGILINQTLDNTGFNIETVTYHLTPAANGCNGPVTDYVVTINPTPNLSNLPLSKSQCDNVATGVTLTSNVAGTLFTWTCVPSSGSITGWANNAVPTTTLNQTLDNTGFNIETVTYQVTPSANGCNGAVINYVITVFPTPNLSNAPASKAQCDNMPTGINLTSSVAGTLFTWTCAPSSANISGWADNAVPTTTLNQTLDNTGFNIETVTYHLTPSANGCNGPVTDYVVTIYPTPDLSNAPASKSQCDNVPTNIVLTSNIAGTLFTWTCTPSSGSVTGWANNAVPTGLLNQTLDNTGFNTETVTYHVMPTANGCNGAMTDYTVTVFPTPNLSNVPLSKSQCDNLPTGVNLTSNVAGTLFTWTCTPSSGSISGWANNALPTTSLNQTLDNTGFNIETVTYHITPAANGCNGASTDYTVTIFPTPDLSNAPASKQICNNASPNVILTSNIAGTLFTWTCTPSSGNITGWANNAVPTALLNQTLTNSGLNIETVIYHMTPAANGCTGPVTDYAVTIVQSPDVFFNPPNQTICSMQTTSINVLSSVPGTTYAWTVIPSSANLSGQFADAGNTIAQTITNSGNTIETVTYVVTPTAWGCPPGNSQNVVVTVNPRPAVSNVILTSQICSGASTNITPTSTVPGSTYTWTASGSSASVTGYANGAGLFIIQPLTNTGFNLETATYAVTPIANGCPGTPTNFTVTVFPVADVIFNPNGQSFCSGLTSSINLSSNVAGTSYTWTAVGSSPNVTGFSPGGGNIIAQTLFNSFYNIETVTYTVAPNANGCPGTSKTVTVSVNPWPVVSFAACFDPVISTTSQVIDLKGGIPLGGTYAGPGVNAGQFLPSFAGPGTHTITYSYTNNYACFGSASQTITVVAPIPFTCGNNLFDVRDNQNYSTVQIGTQCWMATNLNYGNVIPSTSMQLDNCIYEKYCFGDNAANCTATGGMYQWDELMKYGAVSGSQGICPPDWHVPTENDWATLFNFYISNGFAGSPLKSTGFSGFNALLDGTRFNNVQWDFSNFAVMFWSSTSHGPRKAWAHGMNTFNPSVSYYPSLRNNSFYIRCIKN